MEKVTIESLCDDTFGLYDENGICVEPDFLTESEAEEWAKDNDYEVVDSFYL